MSRFLEIERDIKSKIYLSKISIKARDDEGQFVIKTGSQGSVLCLKAPDHATKRIWVTSIRRHMQYIQSKEKNGSNEMEKNLLPDEQEAIHFRDDLWVAPNSDPDDILVDELDEMEYVDDINVQRSYSESSDQYI